MAKQYGIDQILTAVRLARPCLERQFFRFRESTLIDRNRDQGCVPKTHHFPFERRSVCRITVRPENKAIRTFLFSDIHSFQKFLFSSDLKIPDKQH
jgi:hypothetical protein